MATSRKGYQTSTKDTQPVDTGASRNWLLSLVDKYNEWTQKRVQGAQGSVPFGAGGQEAHWLRNYQPPQNTAPPMQNTNKLSPDPNRTRVDPYRLYYSPDQVADEHGNLRPGLNEFAPFRGYNAFAQAYGYVPDFFLGQQPGGGRGGGGGGGGRGLVTGPPFDYPYSPPPQPQFERPEQREWDTRDPAEAYKKPEEPLPSAYEPGELPKHLSKLIG